MKNKPIVCICVCEYSVNGVLYLAVVWMNVLAWIVVCVHIYLYTGKIPLFIFSSLVKSF